ncbi:MAG: FHA domain-containing protein [Deltaproteobacteria bacterium]|nr:FHA domain-containing protein [Deltaproteobacteria bacterium]MBW1871444.1 FHA domain-containing protein [Deltaproteobacteria bacterium]
MGEISQYLQQAHSLDRDTFVANNAEPFLVRQKENETVDPRNEYRSTLKLRIDTERKEVRIEPRPPWPTDLVIPLAKTDRNSFSAKVLVGRTETNDIVIPHLTVSKHHAFFSDDPDAKRSTVTDTGSTNGTKLNGQRIEAKKARYLTDGDQIAFGDILFTFYTPGGFYDLLRSLSALR